MKKLFSSTWARVGLALLLSGILINVMMFATLGLLFTPIGWLLVIVGLVLIIMEIRKPTAPARAQYYGYSRFDERQKIIRGNVFTHGFFILVVGLFVLSFVMHRLSPWLTVQAQMIGLIYLVMLITVSELILRDAYQAEGKDWTQNFAWIYVLLGIGFLSIFIGIQVFKDPLIHFPLQFEVLTPLLNGILFTMITILSIIKQWWNKKH